MVQSKWSLTIHTSLLIKYLPLFMLLLILSYHLNIFANFVRDNSCYYSGPNPLKGLDVLGQGLTSLTDFVLYVTCISILI